MTPGQPEGLDGVSLEVRELRRLQALAEPNTILAHDKLKGALIEEFSLTDMGMQGVRSFGNLRLMSVSDSPSKAIRQRGI